MQSGEYVPIEQYDVVLLDEPITVYNFHVEDFECYYVSGQRVLVHNNNDCGASTKSKNLPSYKKIKVNTGHIMSGHAKGGSRLAPGHQKSLFPDSYSSARVRKAVLNAYKRGKKVQTQGDKFKVRGNDGDMRIEMWVNRATNTIDTAYPI